MELVPHPSDHLAIGTKWVFSNKMVESGNYIVRNKATLVAQWYSQEEEGIDNRVWGKFCSCC